MGHSAYYTASDWARFGHSAMDNEKGYGYMQYYDGQVLLSAPAGKTLSLSIDNSSQVLLNGSTVTISVPIASTVVAGTFLYRTQGATTTAGYDYTIYDRDSTALAGAGAKIVEVARTGATHTGMPLSAVYGSENGNVVITSEDNTKALRFGFGWGLFAEKLSISNTAITASVPIKMTNMQLSNTGSYGGIWGSDIATPSTTNYSFLALNDGTTTSVSGSTSVSLNLAGAIQVYMDANQLSTTVPVVQKTTGYNLTTYIQLVNNSTYNLQPGSYNSYYASGSLTAQTFVIGTTFMQQGSVAYLTLEARDTVIQLNLQWPRQDGTGVNYLYISKSTGPSIKSVDLIIVRCGSGFKVIGNTYS